MKYLTFTCALVAASTNALSLNTEVQQPSIEINISGYADMADDAVDGEVIEINIDLDDGDSQQDAVDVNYTEMEDTDSDYDTVFQSLSHQMDHTEDLMDDPLQGGYYTENPYDDPSLQAGFGFNFGDDGIGFNIDLSSGQDDGNNVQYPTLEAGFGFNIDLGSGGQDGTCWLKSYGRGVGNVITDCPSDKDKSGLLCYPKCNAGYTGVGPVCWQQCPSGYRDDGAFCAKPAPYGRGVGSFSNHSGWERWGLLYYPKCKPGFHNVGCCICSPDCQDGMVDIGVSCTKKSYGRTAGTPLGCSPGLEMSGALCYPPCQNGTTGIGPVCWGYCPAGTKQCGALCMGPDQECSDYIGKVTIDVLSVVGSAVSEDIAGAVSGSAGVVDNFTFPVCTGYNN